MREKKLQVFVSSTYSDLREERQAAVEAILSSGHIPAGMELFTSGDESQMTVIKRWINESDVYLLILGGRYGSIDSKAGKSYTHLEYEYALERKKPSFAVVITEDTIKKRVKEKGVEVIEQENPQMLKEFRNLVTSNVVKFWEDYKDIKIAIVEKLAEYNSRKDLLGWVRGDNTVNASFLAEEMARLTKENSDLRERMINHNSGQEPLYSSLKYWELEDLLKKDVIIESENEKTIFDFLIMNGERLADGVRLGKSETLKIELLRKLTFYKLVRNVGLNGRLIYRFTEDGHNFYLKALSMNKVS